MSFNSDNFKGETKMYNAKTTENDYVTLIVTHECNRHCPFCIDRYRGNNEYIKMVDVRRGLEFAKEFGAKDILLLGGEPTLHPEIVEIAKEVKRYGFNCVLTTNYSNPEVVRSLDGIVDSFNISYYGQRNLPDQKDFISDITLSTLIWKGRFQSLADFDEFIDQYGSRFHLKFSTLEGCNDWCVRHQKVDFLDNLPGAEDIVLFGNNLGHIY